MRLRTKLFLTSVAAMTILWLAAFVLIHRVVTSRINQMAQEAFASTKQGLSRMQKTRVDRMRQAGQLLINIPELRALIAEQNYEISEENRVSLRERLDYLESVTGVSFVSVLDARRDVIAKSKHAPWTGVEQMKQFCTTEPQPSALISTLFTHPGTETTDTAFDGLWPIDGKLYHVVGIPLVFDRDSITGSGSVDGALILGEQIDDAAAVELAGSRNGHISFFNGDKLIASSLPTGLRYKLAELNKRNHWLALQSFIFELDGTTFHGSIDVLRDPHSDTAVGQMLIQCDEQDHTVENKFIESLALIMIAGVVAAGIGSFAISHAVTNPVRALVAGVQSVAQGQLDLSLPATRKDELGLLATSFNDMVRQLRSRRELERKMEEAQSSSQAKSQFLANMSHEIRTPLNGVLGMTELLLGTNLSEQQRRFASLARASGELLTTVINDILDFSKIEAGKLEIESIEFNLHETVEEVLNLLNEKAAKKHLEVACHFDRDVPMIVTGDPGRLRQIVVNLVNNAIKFTTDGSVVVSVTPLEMGTSDALIRFAITDTGIGIPPARAAQLFKPFMQVDASTTRKYGGTGLGLAIVKQLAELMGGSVGVESEIGRGSTFWFTARLGRHAPVHFTTANPQSMRVLVVDDSQTTRDSLRQQLASWGVDCELVDSSASALAAIDAAAMDEKPFKVVLIDGDLAGGSTSLTHAIKGNLIHANTALLALLPLERSPDPAQLHADGFVGHMTKPIRQSQLFDGLMRGIARLHAASPRDGEATQAPVVPKASVADEGERDGARILVAEDNEVNQIVITELLGRAGYTVQCVDSGRKVIDLVFAGGFDLVLMDCQMPELDGLEATKIIRQREATEKRPRMPIIALTANAMKGDREQCLEAGMDAYCSKPVDDRRLRATIASLLPAKAAMEPVQPAGTPTAGAAPQLDGSPAILIDTLIRRCSHNAKTVDLILSKLEKQAERDLAMLRESIGASDAASVARVAHSLKGAAAIAAADRLAAAAAALEQSGRESLVDQFESQLSTLKHEIERCVQSLPTLRTVASERLAARLAAKKAGEKTT